MHEIIPPGKNKDTPGAGEPDANKKDGFAGPLAQETPGNVAGASGDTRTLQIFGNVHLHGNDLAELRKIAEVNPELAEKIVDQRDGEDIRAHASYRFGLVTVVGLLTILMGGFILCAYLFGLWTTLLLIALVLAVAVMIRVVLTGEWSDTTWFGQLVGGLAKALGSEPPEKKS